MSRPAPTSPSLHWRLTVLTMVAVALAFGVLALAPATPPVSSDELSGAIDHLTDRTGAPATESASNGPRATQGR